MPRVSAEHRARMCSFSYSDGRRCRLPRAATGEGYCHAHAAKLRKQRAEECVAGLLTEPIAHQALSSTSLTFMLARLFALVANGHVPPKTSNALLRIVDGLRKTLSNTTREFLNCYDTRGLRSLVESLYNEQEEFLRLTQSESPADAAPPLLSQPPEPQTTISPAPLFLQTNSSSVSNNALPLASSLRQLGIVSRRGLQRPHKRFAMSGALAPEVQTKHFFRRARPTCKNTNSGKCGKCRTYKQCRPQVWQTQDLILVSHFGTHPFTGATRGAYPS